MWLSYLRICDKPKKCNYLGKNVPSSLIGLNEESKNKCETQCGWRGRNGGRVFAFLTIIDGLTS